MYAATTKDEGNAADGRFSTAFKDSTPIFPGLFKPPVDNGRLLTKGIGWLTWKQLRKILETTRQHFRTEAERRFVGDLIIYLNDKVRKGERIRNERKQPSFWQI